MSKNQENPGSTEKRESRGTPWRIALLVVCTVGTLLSADLLRLHINVHTDPEYHSYCAVSEQVNCETVASSSYSIFLGIPIATWGLLGYLLMGALAIWGLRRNAERVPTWPYGMLFGLTLISTVVGLVLFAISKFIINSMCIICMGTYVTSITAMGLSLVVLHHGGVKPFKALADDLQTARSRRQAPMTFAIIAGIVTLATWFGLPRYWEVDTSVGPGGLHIGESDDGHFWIGARRPQLTISEFSDYQCVHCNRGHRQIRSIIEEHPEKIRLIHHHFPLRRHAFSLDYSKLAVCAGKQGRFWEANDYLFSNGRRREQVKVDELAQELELDEARLDKCFESVEALREVEGDEEAGKALSIRGTPWFMIGDQSYPGRIPQKVIDEALGIERE